MSNVMSKVKGFVKENRKAFSVSLMSALVACTSVVSASAVDEAAAASSENIVAQFNTSLQQMQGDIINLILTCIPVALTIFGLVIAVNKGIQVTKSMIGKS